MAKIRKAVFPVAGLGTRFLPATKASPKEMMSIVDKPLIQYAAEEAEEAGATQLVFITGRNKRSIEDHFDKAYELEAELESAGKLQLLDIVQNVMPPSVTCIYVRQAEALGLGHAVLCAKAVVGDEPFAVILADDLIHCQGKGVVEQMSDVYERFGCSVLSVQEVPREETNKYGIVKVKPGPDGELRVVSIVEKPAPEAAPSNLAVVGRYVLTPAIFELLERTQKGAGGEIQLTDAIAALLAAERVDAFRFQGTRFDCGTHIGLIEATIRHALDHEKLSEAAQGFMRDALSELGVVDS